MRKAYLLILSIFIVLFFGILLSIAFLRVNMQFRYVELKKASVSAFYAAEVGIERAIDALRKNGDWQSFTGFGDSNSPVVLTVQQGGNSIITGYYWIDRDGPNNSLNDDDDDVKNGGSFMSWPSTVWVRSHGQDPHRRITRTICARIAVQSPTEYFLSTPGDLTIKGGANINADILCKNVKFSPAGTPITVNGVVYYIVNLDINWNDPITITCQDGSGQDCVVELPSITFASLDMDWYRTQAQAGGIYIHGDFEYNGDISWTDLASAASSAGGSINGNNGLIFVDGDVKIQGTIKEPIHIVSAQNIYVTGDIVKDSQAQNPQLGLSAKKDVIIPQQAPSSLTIEAFIYADGGSFYAEGSKYTKGNLNFSGAMSVRGSSYGSAVDLNVYQNRNYNYDTNLKTNLHIPFISYIANLIQWKELKATDSFPPTTIP